MAATHRETDGFGELREALAGLPLRNGERELPRIAGAFPKQHASRFRLSQLPQPLSAAEAIDDEAAQRFGVVSGVCDDMADAGKVADQPLGLRAVSPVPGRDREPDRQAERVHGRMDIGRQSAARTAYGVSFKPPFCEVASA